MRKKTGITPEMSDQVDWRSAFRETTKNTFRITMEGQHYRFEIFVNGKPGPDLTELNPDQTYFFSRPEIPRWINYSFKEQKVGGFPGNPN